MVNYSSKAILKTVGLELGRQTFQAQPPACSPALRVLCDRRGSLGIVGGRLSEIHAPK